MSETKNFKHLVNLNCSFLYTESCIYIVFFYHKQMVILSGCRNKYTQRQKTSMALFDYANHPYLPYTLKYLLTCSNI